MHCSSSDSSPIPELLDLPDPEPGPGQVVIKVGGAGLCHSDLHVMHEFQEGMAPWGPPFVMGHENAGWVHSIGPGVRGVEEGLPVAVYGLYGCGRCKPCAAGAENFCIHGWRARLASGSVSTVGWPSTCSCTIRGGSYRSVIWIRRSQRRSPMPVSPVPCRKAGAAEA